MSSYTLHIQYVDRPAETRTFTQAKVTLGRDSGDIVLHDTQVSGRHGEITFEGGTLRYTDVGSTNGSFLLQGQRVANIELTPGIALRLGNSLITVQVIDAPNVAGKGRTVIAGPGMAPGFPAPMRPPGAPTPPAGPAAAGIPRPGMPFPAPAPPSPPPGAFAHAPTAQMQSPGMPPGMPVGPAAPGMSGVPGMPVMAPPPGAFVPQPMQPMTMPAPVPGAPLGGPAPMTPVPMPASNPITQPPTPSTQPPPGIPSIASPMAPPGPPPGGYAAMPQVPGPAAPPMSSMSAPAMSSPAMSGANAVDPVTGAANDLMGSIMGAWDAIKPQIVPATMITAILTVPMAVLGWFVLVTFGPFGFGGGLLILLALTQLLGTLILTPALVRFVLGVHLGQPVDVRGAIMDQVADIQNVALNFLVFGFIAAVASMFLVVPAVFVAVFVGQIYFVEGKRYFDAIGRNFELVKRDVTTPIVHVFVPALLFGLGLFIAGYILGVLPLIGGLMGALGRAIGQAIMLPIILMLCTRVYFQQRRRFEGGDPEGEARARLGAPALPGA